MRKHNPTAIDWRKFEEADRKHRRSLARLPFERKVEMLRQLQEIARHFRSPRKREQSGEIS